MAQIRPFQKQDMARVVDTMAAAFAEDALCRYFIPENGARQRFLKAFLSFRLRYGLRQGKVLVADGGEGVAIFLLPGHQMSPADLLLCGGLRAMLPRTPVPGTGMEHWGMLWEP